MRFSLRTLLTAMLYAALTFGNLNLVFNSVKGDLNIFQLVAVIAAWAIGVCALYYRR